GPLADRDAGVPPGRRAARSAAALAGGRGGSGRLHQPAGRGGPAGPGRASLRAAAGSSRPGRPTDRPGRPPPAAPAPSPGAWTVLDVLRGEHEPRSARLLLPL